MILDIDPKVDYAFKHLFGRESTRPLLIHLLNCILTSYISQWSFSTRSIPRKRSTTNYRS